MQSIEVYYPFRFSAKTDPRQVVTVGDQVLCEHLFAFHTSGNREDASGSISEIHYDHAAAQVRIIPRHAIIRSDGSRYSVDDLCVALKASFAGTQHAQYDSLLRKVECTQTEAVLHLKEIPVNMAALFGLPDFAAYDPNKLPISNQTLFPTTGPYYATAISETRAELRRNPFYPADLIANSVDHVAINQYHAADTKTLLGQLQPSIHHLVYLYGHAVQRADLEELKARGYRVEEYPSEWMVHLGFQPKLEWADRQLIALSLDVIRQELAEQSPLGQLAFSVPPADRPFSISRERYFQLQTEIARRLGDQRKLSRKVKVGTLSNWFDVPIFKSVITHLETSFPGQIERVIIPSNESGRLYGADIDVYVSVQGISPADPAHHLSFFLKSDPIFSEAVASDEVLALAETQDATTFQNMVRTIEENIVRKRVLMPLMHFPGVVLSAKNFERDDRLSGNWGIRAWTYKIR